MFHDLDETLRKVLTDPARPAGLTGIDPESMFITPDRAFAESVGTKNLTVLNLFLHRIKENRELRETTGYPEPGDDPSVRRLPLLRVDCSYVVTTWCKVDVTTDLMTEHKLLGLALQWLSRFPEIPAASPVTPNHPYLAGALARPDLPLPVSMAARRTCRSISAAIASTLPSRPFSGPGAMRTWNSEASRRAMSGLSVSVRST